jgi:hypothetical protein
VKREFPAPFPRNLYREFSGRTHMKLTIQERLTVFALLPEKGTFLNLKQVREARENLSFTEDEHKKYGFKNHPDGKLTWSLVDGKPDEPVDIELTEQACSLVRKSLEDLDKAGALEQGHFTVYEKFVV